jgi:hypothetical protein
MDGLGVQENGEGMPQQGVDDCIIAYNTFNTWAWRLQTELPLNVSRSGTVWTRGARGEVAVFQLPLVDARWRTGKVPQLQEES